MFVEIWIVTVCVTQLMVQFLCEKDQVRGVVYLFFCKGWSDCGDVIVKFTERIPETKPEQLLVTDISNGCKTRS